jgi:hypothetical protein
MGMFNLLLTFQNNVSYHLDLKKYHKSIPNNFVNI